MGLLTTYGAANRVIDTDLTITYEKRKTYGDWVHTVLAGEDHYYEAYEITRYAKKSYRYVGMDHATALACAAAMVTKYTRDQKDSVWGLGGDGDEFDEPTTKSQIVMAEVTPTHNDGGMWSVVVNVNETDTRMRRQVVGSVSSLFFAENNRDYDED